MNQDPPDRAEQEHANDVDDAIPARGYAAQPLVGLGGSAGAIPALSELLEAMPARCGLSFVVVIHLARDHESTLAQVLQRRTGMPVVQVQGTVKLEPDHVYVIPPGKSLKATDGYLQLAALPDGKGRHVAVDLFFRTLADCHGPHAAAVVLSGLDGDGAIGIKRIKERGGLTIAQDPQEAQSPGMPHTAIATGMVDWVLRVAEMPARLVSYFQREKGLELPLEEAPENGASSPAGTEAALRDVLSFLRTRTGRDFSPYKRATVVRRIGRRMQVNGVDSIQEYLDCLRTRPGEASALLQDLLISVTNFFRDASCFDALKTGIPALFAGKGPVDSVRAWVVACATGEEAYSVAILLLEHARLLDKAPTLQVFATDLSEDALRVAREGIYPTTIEADIPDDLLRRYFSREAHGWRVRRELREIVLFAVHDVLKDSPFSRLDIVTCRNLLIYLNRAAQDRAFAIMHFSLRAGGTLFLGASEAVVESSALFKVEDKRHRIYSRLDAGRSGMPLPVPIPGGGGPFALSLVETANRGSLAAELTPRSPDSPALSRRGPSWADMHLLLLEQMVGPSVLVTSAYQILHLSQSVGRFLQFSGGDLSSDLMHAVHPDLRMALRTALFEAQESFRPVHVAGLSVTLQDVTIAVDLRITPMPGGTDGGYLLVLFDTHEAESNAAVQTVGSRPDPFARHLEFELERLKAHLLETVEQHEASMEELKASNEELQAMNEELRSAGEELETGREEVQSINEELTTVNQELKSKVDLLGQANADMQNLMDATAIPTIFLDRELRITRFTPPAVLLFNLIGSDIGRPLADLSGALDYPQLQNDALQVLEHLSPVEREVPHDSGQCFLARVVPYRTLDQRIAGVVLAFIDITSRRKAIEMQEWLSAVVSSSTDAIVSFSLDLTIRSWNGGAERVFGYSAAEAIGRPLTLIAPPSAHAELTQAVVALRDGHVIEGLLARRRRKDGVDIDVLTTFSPIRDGAGQVIAATALFRDITAELAARQALHSSDERLRLMIESAREYAIFSMDLERQVTSWSVGAQRLLQYAEKDMLGERADRIFVPEDREAGQPQEEARRAMLDGRSNDDRFYLRQDGSRFWASGATMPMFDPAGKPVGLVKVLRDQTEQREAEQALRDIQVELEHAHVAKDRFLAMLSHELRNPLTSVVSATDLLLTPDVPAPAAERAAQVVRRQSNAMKVLLDDMLDVSRMSLGRITLRLRVVRLQEVIEAAVEMTHPLVAGRHHRLTVQVPDQEALINADPLRLTQVVANLLGNAAKYTPEGGTVELLAEVKDAQAIVTIVDNGIGMKSEDVERMFELFVQAQEAVGRSEGGLGIGLALARHIVGLHGGWIVAKSDGAGLGTQVEFGLPLLASGATPPLPAPATGIDATDTPEDQARRVILVADDNVDAAWAITQLLTIRGFRVLQAADGWGAWDLMQEHRPSVALLDIGMPGLDGLELARRIRATEWGRSIVLIAATGWGQELDVQRSLEAGFDEHLTKPLEVAKLSALVQKFDERMPPISADN